MSADMQPGLGGPNLDPPTSFTRKFVRYVMGFGVAVAVGLAPFLGRLDIPLFSPLLDLYPVSLQSALIPLSSFLMGLVAVAGQFHAKRRSGRDQRRKIFYMMLIVTIVAFVVLAAAYFFLVVTVSVPAVDGSVSFIVSPVRTMDCPCEPGLSASKCIKQLSLDPAEIETCWGDLPVRTSRLFVALTYLATMGGFGSLIGLLLSGPAEKGHPSVGGGAPEASSGLVEQSLE